MDATRIDPLWDMVGIAEQSPDDPQPKWCLTCGPSVPLLASDPDYCELCDLHRAWRREDAQEGR